MALHDSNHLLADRRLAWARALAAEDDHAAAADLLDQVVEMVPDWAPAWAALAEARERAGPAAAARAAWARAAELDPEGRLGAEWRLSGLDEGAREEMPDAYVRALFDDYALRFERHLTGPLRYRGPHLLAAALEAAAPAARFGEALDLGCGTGLMAAALAARVEALDGVDLSPKMIAAARGTALYRDLSVAPLGAALAEAKAGRYDLVIAADVLVYVGALTQTFGAVARVLAADGLFAFTAQLRAESAAADAGFVLGPDLRFAHSEAYVRAELAAAGLALVSIAEAWARVENGIAVPGLVVVARRA